MPRLRAATALTLFAALATAQTPADLEELAQQTESAHRTADAKPIPGFTADLRLKELARDAEHRGDLELSVAFLEWQPPEQDRPWPLIRYKQVDSARQVEQGRDRQDYWSYGDGKLHDMRAREMATDLEHCQRNIKLARQMIRFLDPGAVLRSLEQPEPVVDAALVQGRALDLPCRVAKGRIASFPLRQQQGDDAAVQARIFVAKEDHRLAGIEVLPLDADGKPQADRGEFLLFREHRLTAGRLVPMRVVHFALDAIGQRQALMAVEIVRLDLDADLDAAHFDRPK